jgi:hypothetical protein
MNDMPTRFCTHVTFTSANPPKLAHFIELSPSGTTTRLLATGDSAMYLSSTASLEAQAVSCLPGSIVLVGQDRKGWIVQVPQPAPTFSGVDTDTLSAIPASRMPARGTTTNRTRIGHS